jgi:lysophospholipase L1-like esterase/enterochelin esterase-like enzyme
MKKLLCIFALLALVGSCFGEPVRIVAYGDSITYGWIPNANPPSTRYGPDDRWPGALQKELGENYQVIEEGLDGRTTDARDPGSSISGAQLDGSAYLPACLASHLPVDLVVIMLGTNDLKPVFNRTPLRIAIGAAHLIDLVNTLNGGVGTTYKNPKVLLICPPPLNPEIEKGPVFGEMFKGGLEKSQKLPELYEAVAKMGGAEFLNAGSVISTDGVDGLHLTGESERKLGVAVAAKVKEMALAQAQATSGQAVPPMPPGPNPNSQYRLGPDSMAQEGVPKGNIRGPYTLPSKVYPGTQHTYWVYVPAQYDPEIPTSLMIYQEGQAFKDQKGDLRAQNVMDNLIYRREIPVMIGVFINPGRTPDQPEPSPQTSWGDDTTNRRTEYNTPDDKYARVITEELMPVLYKEYNISKDPEQHGIGGSSSGAIAAFAVAWERPNDFRKVLSNVGSFVDLRGGYVYPERVLASEKKPIRIFLCDGRNDNRGTRNGVYDEKLDWFLQNVRLMKALAQKGYDVNYSWGVNLHGQKFGGAIMPDMMRWLWRDGPVSTDPNDMVERGFRQPITKTN